MKKGKRLLSIKKGNGGGGGSQSLAQTLAIGDDANQLDIINLNTLKGGDNILLTITDDGGGGVAVAPIGNLLLEANSAGVTINAGTNILIQNGGIEVAKFDTIGFYTDTITELTPTGGVLISGAGIATDIGTLGEGGTWKLGNVVSIASVLDETRFLEVEVDGIRVKIALIV